MMRESIHKYFQIGLISFMAYPANMRGHDGDILKTIKQIACDDYFDAIELNWIHSPQLRLQAAKMLETAHMTVCYGAQPRLLTTGLNPNAPDEEKRLEAEKTLLEAIDEAHVLGARSVAFLSGRWEPESRDVCYRQLVKTTKRLCAYAQEKDMTVELEVFDYDIAKKALIGPAPYAARFAAEIREEYPNFGLLIDLSHIPMTHETGAFVVRTLRPYLTHFHIGNTVICSSDTEGYGDEHPRFGFPHSVNDTAQVLAFLRVLRREGFFDAEAPYVLSFEVKPWKDEDPDIVVANAKRVLNRAWALLEEE